MRQGLRTPCETCGGADGAACRCTEIVRAFAARMVFELEENYGKGGRSEYRRYGVEKSLAEVGDHIAKLHVVARELHRRQRGEPPRAMPWDKPLERLAHEFAADVGNCVVGLLDNLGLWEGDPPGADAIGVTALREGISA